MSVLPACFSPPADPERDNARLRALLAALRSRFATACPGSYLVTDDGCLDGPYPDIRKAARDCAADGLACTVVVVGERLEAASGPEDCGARPGVDHPGTLGPRLDPETWLPRGCARPPF